VNLEEVEPASIGRVVSAGNDTAAATEDGPAVVVPVLTNDLGVVAVATINGAPVTAGSLITLPSGAQILVNANGTLSYLPGAAFQALGAGQTTTDSFVYTATDGGASAVAPDGLISTSQITGALGFSFFGASAGDTAGYAVAGIGDINGDGLDDILIGALQADPSTGTNAGVSYVILGKVGGYASPIDLGALNGTNGFSIKGVSAFDFSGASVSGIGDVNDDGLDDFIVGAPRADAAAGLDAGAAYVVFGRNGGFGATLDLSSLDGTNGYAIRGGGAGDGLGLAVSAAGDINNDGIADLIVGARQGEASSGLSYVVFGTAEARAATVDVRTLNGNNGFSISGIDAGDLSGMSVSSAGDLNNDGFDDLIIGAPNGDPGGRSNAGEAYVLFGKTGGFAASIDLASLNGTNGFTINGVTAGDYAGWSVASVGDLNNDGIDDVAIGALYADPAGKISAGQVYILYGRNGGFGSMVNLSSLTSSTGSIISGAIAGDLTGYAVSSAGDLNGDGVDDLLIGALYGDSADGADAGQSYVLFGRTGGLGLNVDLSLLNGVGGFAIAGAIPGAYAGGAVTAAGDVNGDGVDDLLIGAPNADPSGRTDAGGGFVLYGATNIAQQTGAATVTVTITGVNDAPVITSDGGGAVANLSRTENSQTVTTVAASDADAGAVVVYSIDGGADAALFVINSATGVLSFVTASDFEAPADVGGDNIYEVVVKASDGAASDSQTILVQINNAGEAPVITSNGGGASGAFSVSENGVGSNVVTATGADPGQIRYSIVGGADQAKFTIDALTGELKFKAAPNFETPADAGGDNVYDVVVAASDGTLSDTQALTVTVVNVNEAPRIISLGGGDTANAAINENSVGAIRILSSDPDAGANLTYSVTGGADAALFVIDPASGILRFANPQDFEAPADANADNGYEVIVTVSDGALTDSQTLTVRVKNVNEAPVITANGGGVSATLSTVENSLFPVSMTASDPDAGANLVYSIIGGADAALFQIDPATGLLQFLTAPDFEAPTDQGANNSYQVVVQVSDGTRTDKQTLNILVTDTPDSFAITSNGGGAAGGYAVSENTNGSNAVTVTDAVGPVSYSIIGGADQAAFAINAATGELTLINAPDFEAPADSNGDNVYQVVVQATDGTSTDTQSLNVTILDVNEAPVITSNGGGATGSYTVSENSRGSNFVTATDPEGGAPPFSITGGADAALFGINGATGELQFINAPDFENPADANQDNVYEVTVTVFDGALSDSQTLFVTVQDVAEAPVISSNGGGDVGGYSIFENTLGPNTVSASDPEGATVTYSIAGGADAELFTINTTTGVIQLISPQDYEAPADANSDNVYEVVVTASDGFLTDSQTINLTILDADEAPVITSNGGGPVGSYSISENTLGPNTVSATDSDGTVPTYSIVGGADALAFEIDSVSGVLQLVSAVNFEEPSDDNGDNIYEVIVRASDGALFDDQTINLTINDVNEAPEIISDGGGATATLSIVENTVSVTTIEANDPDTESAPTYSIVGGEDETQFTIDPQTGALSFVVAPDFEAPSDSNGDNVYEVIVRASDGTLFDDQAISVGVTDGVEGPVLNDLVSNLTVNEGDYGALIDPDVSFSSGTTDFDGGTLIVSGLTQTDAVWIQSIGLVDHTEGPVFYDSIAIGNVSGGFGDDLVLTFNANATQAAIDAVVEALTYRSYSDVPVADHSLTIEITDGLLQSTGPKDFVVSFIADILIGTADDDYRSGQRGDDHIIGYAGHDYLEGGVGNDTIEGGSGDDTLDGGDDNDFLLGGTGDDEAYGGLGADILVGGRGRDYLEGGDGADSLYGGDHLTAEGLLLQAVADMESDTLDGGDGDDVLFVSYNDIANGGLGTDTVFASFLAANGGVFLDFSVDAESGLAEELGAVLSNFESFSVWGSQYGDSFYGDDGTNTIVGDAGDDFLDGGAGTDQLRGGLGRDELFGGDDNDVLFGGEGADRLTGGLGDDQLYGDSDGSSRPQYGQGPDTAVYNGSSSAYTLTQISADTWTVTGPEGTDTLIGIEFVEFLNTTIAIGAMPGEIFDVSEGGSNYAGTSGDDDARGDFDGNTLEGFGGDDTLAGGFGQDSLDGGDGRDRLDGGEGDDRLDGGSGDDFINGGGGEDTAVFSGNAADYTITFGPRGQITVENGIDTDHLINVEYLEFADATLDVHNDAPVITSDGGDQTATVAVKENDTFVLTVQATDAQINDVIYYRIVGGADAALFSIDTETGDLVFIDSPNFEAPRDSNTDNVYEVIVAADDGLAIDTQTVSVVVTDVSEPNTLPPPPKGDEGYDVVMGAGLIDTKPVDVAFPEMTRGGFAHHDWLF
jgi:Ca2+-binding RTX toxin-like protein